jgi:hypothetical protein
MYYYLSAVQEFKPKKMKLISSRNSTQLMTLSTTGEGMSVEGANEQCCQVFFRQNGPQRNKVTLHLHRQLSVSINAHKILFLALSLQSLSNVCQFPSPSRSSRKRNTAELLYSLNSLNKGPCQRNTKTTQQSPATVPQTR